MLLALAAAVAGLVLGALWRRRERRTTNDER
jgi:hypothetical protein